MKQRRWYQNGQNLFVAFAMGMILLVSWYLIHAGQEVDILLGQAAEKRVLLEKVLLSGWQHDQKVWQIRAQNGWQTNNREQLVLESLSQGEIFRGNEVLVEVHEAPTLFIRNAVGDFDIYPTLLGEGSPEAGVIRATARLRVNEASPKPYQVQADKLQYRASLQKLYLNGHVRLTTKNDRIETSKMEVNLKEDIGILEADPVVTLGKLTLKGKSIQADLKTGAVTINEAPDLLLHEGETPLHLTAERLITRTDPEQIVVAEEASIEQKHYAVEAGRVALALDDETAQLQQRVEIVLLSESSEDPVTRIYGEAFSLHRTKENFETNQALRILQKDKWVQANQGSYEKGGDLFTLTGDVKAELTSVESLLRKERIDAIKNKEVLKGIRSPTTLTTKALKLHPKTRDATAIGNVVVTQQGRVVRSQKAFYDHTTEVITMETGVEIQKENGEWIKAKKVLVDVAGQTLQAIDVERAKLIL